MTFTLDPTIPEELAELGKTIGLVNNAGQLDATWFEAPKDHLKTIISEPTQRAAVLGLLRSMLGTAGPDLGLSGATSDNWYPVVTHTEGSTTFDLFVIIEEQSDGALDLSLGGRIAATPSPALSSAAAMQIPLVRITTEGGSLLAGDFEVATTLDFPNGLGNSLVGLAGVSLTASIPTDDPTDATLDVMLRGLRLPGQASGEDISLVDLTDNLGSTSVRIGLGLLQAQMGNLDPAIRHVLALAGLDPSVPAIPTLPMADLLSDGIDALRTWFLELVGDTSKLAAWLGELAEVFGLDAGDVTTVGDTVSFCLEDPPWRACFHLVASSDAATGIANVTPRITAQVTPSAATQGRVAATLDLCSIILGPHPTISPMPSMKVTAELGDDTTTIVPGPEITVGSFAMGVGLDGGALVPVIEARRVVIGTTTHEVLDLSSADAMTGAAGTALSVAIAALVEELGVTTTDEGRAFAALAGLVKPGTAPATWEPLVDHGELFANPINAIACYHTRVLGAGQWAHIAAEFGVLLRTAGVAAPTVAGSGIANDPWTLELFDNTASGDPVKGTAAMVMWSDPPNGVGPKLHVGVQVTPEVPPLDGKTLTASYLVEILTVLLPVLPGCATTPELNWVGCHTLTMRIGDDLVLDIDSLTLMADSASIGLRWCGGDTLETSYSVKNPQIDVDGTMIALGDFELDFGLDLPDLDLGALNWDALRLIIGDWFSGSSGSWWPRLGSLLGWLPDLGDITIRLPSFPDVDIDLPEVDWPNLSLPDLFGGDPWGAIKGWLLSLFSGDGGDWPDFSLPFLGWLSSLFGDLGGDTGTLQIAATGSGTYEDPWAIKIGTTDPELLLWLDPNGPSLGGLAALVAHLVPDELTDAADDVGAGLTMENIVELLNRAGSLVPTLRNHLSGLDAATAITALRSTLVDGDGLVPAAAQNPGWPQVDLEPTAHLLEPAAFDATTHLPAGAPPASRRVFVATDLPGLAEWPGQTDDKTIDLTTKGLRPESFDLTAIQGAGPWFIMLPGRADAEVRDPGDDPTDPPQLSGLDGLTARLERAVTQIRTAVGGDIALVGHSTAGQIARLVGAKPGISHLVTIGTPHATVDLSFLDDNEAGEAIRLLQRLRNEIDTAGASGHLETLLGMLDTLGTAIDEHVSDATGLLTFKPLPTEDFAAPAFPALDAATQPLAVVGTIAGERFDRGVAALATRLLETLRDALPASGTITHLGFGLRAIVASGGDGVGQVSVTTSARLDLGRIELQAGADRPTPRLQVNTTLRRNQGWLAGGPGTATPIARPRDPRVRWAEVDLVVDLDPLAADAQVVLHDASVFGVTKNRWVIDDKDFTTTLVPEARILLGAVVGEFGTLPGSGSVRQFFDMLDALKVVVIDESGATPTITMPPEPIERLLVDPLNELRTRLTAELPERTKLLDTIRTYVGASGTGNQLIIPFGEDLEFLVDIGTVAPPQSPTLHIRTTGTGLTIEDTIVVSGSVEHVVGGDTTATVTVGTTAPIGPAGKVVAAVSYDSATPTPVIVGVSIVDSVAPAFDGSIQLVPTPDQPALVSWFSSFLPGQLLRIALEWASDQSEAIDSLVVLAGLRRPDGPVVNPAAFLRDGAAWLTHPDTLGREPSSDGLTRLSPAKIQTLASGFRELLGSPGGAPTDPIDLPWGLSIKVAESIGGDVALDIDWDPPPLGAVVTPTTGIRLVVGAGFVVTTSFDATISLTGTPGFASADLVVDIDTSGNASVQVTLNQTGRPPIGIGLMPAPGFTNLEELGGAAVTAVLPPVLKALSSPGLPFGPAIGSIGDALQLRQGNEYSASALSQLASAPTARFVEILPSVAGPARDALLTAIDTIVNLILGVGSASVDVGAGSVTITPFQSGDTSLQVGLRLTPTGPELCIEAVDLEPLPNQIRADARICVDATGLSGLRIGLEVIDPSLLEVGAVSFLPASTVLVGSEAQTSAAGTEANRVEVGLWIEEPLSAPGTRRGVFAAIPTDQSATSVVCRTQTRNGAGATNHVDAADLTECARDVALNLLVPMVGELVLEIQEVKDLLETTLPSLGSKAIGTLLDAAEIVERSSPANYDLVPGFLDPANIAGSIVGLVSELASGVPIPGTGDLEITLRAHADTDEDRDRYGIRFRLTEPLDLFQGEGVKLSAVNDISWVAGAAGREGVSLFLISTALGAITDVEFAPDIDIGGIGLEVAEPNGGKLVDLVAGINAIQANVSYRRTFGNGGGATEASTRLLLKKLTVPLGRAAGGSNPVAAKLLSQGSEDEAAQGGDQQELAPSFTPELIFDFAPTEAFDLRLVEGDLPFWVPIQQSFGPIYVEQIGADTLPVGGPIEKVRLLLDGGVSLQGFALGVDDLSVAIPIKRPGNLEEWELDLAGLAIGYQGSGVSIAGGFRKLEGQYAGMVQIDVAEFGISAIGAYGEFPTNPAPGESQYTSLFIFGVLSAPLGGPPAFFITGVGAGLGLNRRLALPDQISALPQFTLVRAMDSNSGFASDPMGALNGAIADFPAERGTFWLAAGVRFTSFAVVESVAILSFEIGGGVEINILGLSRAVLPVPQLPLASIEMALRARFSSRDMVLSVEAQLTDNSWILNRDCRLTGGFAFVTWFKTGEFVFTLGGYHPNFNKPSYYPVVPRLGFHWQPMGALVIKGESYFALTSSCFMAGGKLEAGYTTSVAWATFTFGADALISWDPFFYDVHVFVRVSAGIKIRICFFACATIKKSLSIGADLYVMGPELSGRAVLDLDYFSVTVKFGAPSANEPAKLDWDAFELKYLLQGDAEDVAMGLSFAEGLQAPDSSTATTDTPPDDGSAARPWQVMPEFVMVIKTRAASSVVKFGSHEFDDLTEDLDVGPMHEVGVRSEFRIELSSLTEEDSNPGAQFDAEEIKAIQELVPDGIWRHVPYKNLSAEAGDRQAYVGLHLTGSPQVFNGGTDVPLDQVKKGDQHPLPFHDEKLSRTGLVALADAAGIYRLGQPKSTQQIFDAASGKLLDKSRFESRVFSAEQTAPPRLAALGENMVDAIKPAVGVEPFVPEPEEPPIIRRPGTPELWGLLRHSPTESLQAAPRMTVNGRSRRGLSPEPMPTLAGVETATPGNVPARLLRAGARIDATGKTVAPAGPTPATGVPGADREIVRSYATEPATAAALRSISERVAERVPLLAGDVQVWRIPDSRADIHRSGPGAAAVAQRPTWQVNGNQLVRTIVLDRAGGVLVDETGDSYRLTLPRGADRVVSVGIGRTDANKAAAQHGIAGWHESARLSQIAHGVYLGPGCTVRVAGGRGPERRRNQSSVKMVNAGKAISGGPTVETRLPANIDTVAVALELVDDGACAEELLDGLALTIDGARQTTDEPIRAAVGNRIMLLFPVEPEGGTDHVSVTVATDEHWHPAGVVGAAMSAPALIDALRQTDLSALLGTVVRAGIGESELRFRAPGRKRPRVEDTPGLVLSRSRKTPAWAANASKRLSGQRRSQARGGQK